MANAGDSGVIPGLERFHMRQSTPCLPSRCHAAISSSSRPRREFSCPSRVKLGPQITVLQECREHGPGTINSVSSPGRSGLSTVALLFRASCFCRGFEVELYQAVISLQGSPIFSYSPSPSEINYLIMGFVPSFCLCENLQTSHDCGPCGLS